VRPHHRRVPVFFRECAERASDGAQVAQKNPVRLLELQNGACVEHVLGGRAEMEIFAVAVRAHRVQRTQCRHQGMVDLADPAAIASRSTFATLALRAISSAAGCGMIPACCSFRSCWKS
jgi:hypothetical protein